MPLIASIIASIPSLPRIVNDIIRCSDEHRASDLTLNLVSCPREIVLNYLIVRKFMFNNHSPPSSCGLIAAGSRSAQNMARAHTSIPQPLPLWPRSPAQPPSSFSVTLKLKWTLRLCGALPFYSTLALIFNPSHPSHCIPFTRCLIGRVPAR
jgi:hypothetical protein